MKRVIIDTDPGIDDTAAILLALASPELSVEAVTTVYGNGYVEDCTRNALTILEAAGRGDIPVYQGAGKPLTRAPNIGSQVHGKDALGDANVPPPHGTPQREHAVWPLIELVMSNPGEITLLALGPLTNVALALSIEPRMATVLKELVLMGGAVLTWGNASEVASANLYNDPEAAAVVYQSGAPIVQVGLDVCRKVQIRADQLARIQQGTGPTIDLLTRITPQIVRFYTGQGNLPRGGVQYNDVPAVAYAIDPGFFEIHDYFVRISTHDELTKGQTVADVGNRWGQAPNARVLMDVDSDRLTEMFTSRILGYEQPATAAR